MKKCLIFVLLLCSLLLLFGQQARAAVFDDIVSQLEVLEQKGIAGEGLADKFSRTISSNDKSYINQYGLYTLIFTSSSSSVMPNNFIFLLSWNSAKITNDNQGRWTNFFNVTYGNKSWTTVQSTSAGGAYLNNCTFDYVYTTREIDTTALKLGANEEYGGSYLFNTFEFTPFLVPIKTLNGISYNIASFSRTIPNWRLGTLDGISEQNNYKCVGFLDRYTGLSWQSVSQIPINSYAQQAQVYLDNTKVLYNNAYRVRFSDAENNTDWTYFIFLPYGESISGDLTSGDLVYTGFDNNDDIPIISAIDNQYEVNSGEISDILAGYLDSGDYFSGDFGQFSTAMGYYQNSYFDKLYTLYRNILNTLTSAGEVNLYISYRNWGMTLHSSDFYVPNNTFKALVTMLLVVWTIFLFYQQIDKMIRNIATFNLYGFLHDTDVDYHMFL